MPSVDLMAASKQPVSMDPVLQPGQIEWLLICCLHDPQLLNDARQIIDERCFEGREAPLLLFWLTMLHCVDRYGGVQFEAMCMTAQELLRSWRGHPLNQSQLDIIFEPSPRGLFWSALQARQAIDPVNKNLARELLSRFGHERTVVGPLRDYLNPNRTGSGVPANLREFLAAISAQESKLATTHEIPRVSMAPEFGAILEPASVFRLTGIPFIDGPLRGQRDGDANGLLGVTGGGKTTMALHMTSTLAKQCYHEGVRPGDNSHSWVGFATYEEPPAKLRPRLWSATFAIPRTKLEVDFTWDSLTTASNLAEYERRMQIGEDILSESDRYRRDAPILRECVEMWDLSGSDAFPNAGFGSVPELVSYVSRTTDARGVPPRAIFIDYAGLVVQRHIMSRNMDMDRNYRMMLKMFADECRMHIAEKFHCTVWITHQIAGAALGSSPGKLLRVNDADECKTFATNTAVCGCIGVRDQKTGCQFLNWDKVRYQPSIKVPPVLMRLDDMFAVVKDVSSQYEVDGGSFLAREELAKIRGGDEEVREAQEGPVGMRNSSWGAVL